MVLEPVLSTPAFFCPQVVPRPLAVVRISVRLSLYAKQAFAKNAILKSRVNDEYLLLILSNFRQKGSRKCPSGRFPQKGGRARYGFRPQVGSVFGGLTFGTGFIPARRNPKKKSGVGWIFGALSHSY